MQQQILNVPPRNLETALRILVVGRDTMSSHLLAEALGRNRGYEAAAIASSQLLPTIRTRKADLLVISADIYASPDHGMELVNAVNRAYPEILIIILLDQPSRELVISAFRYGARGVFSRRQGIPEFLDCIQHVLKGGIWAGRREADYLLEAFKSIPGPNPSYSGTSPLLTRRESQVVRCAAQGKTNRTIANELGLSEHTVKNYLFRVFEKLGVSSRVELLFYLTTQGHRYSMEDSDHLESKLPPSPA